MALEQKRCCLLVIVFLTSTLAFSACRPNLTENRSDGELVSPRINTSVLTSQLGGPAIWINPQNEDESLVLATSRETQGALLAFDLNGRLVNEVGNLSGPSDVDVEYGLDLNGTAVDIAVVVEQLTNRLRIFSLPSLTPLDRGGFPVFEGHWARSPTGVALYRRHSDGSIFAIVNRVTGPANGFLWQYLLSGEEVDRLQSVRIRMFGRWSGRTAISSVTVDDNLGIAYYIDVSYGVRQYLADPDLRDSEMELGVFGRNERSNTLDVVSVFRRNERDGYLVMSDRQDTTSIYLYPRSRQAESERRGEILMARLASYRTVGMDVTSARAGAMFPEGLLVTVSHDQTLHYYSWRDIVNGSYTAPATQPSGE